jgi:hypothetical protein
MSPCTTPSRVPAIILDSMAVRECESAKGNQEYRD